jgi:aspartate aminotransferase
MAKRKKIPVNLNLNVRGLKKSATLAINERSRELAAQGKEIFFLGFGQSPFPVPEPVVEALRRNAHQKDYLAVQGLYQLREAIAAYFQRKQGLDYAPEDIMVSPGSKELLFLLQLVYYGDLVIPMPSWVSYSPQAMIIGRRVNWVKTHAENDWRLSPKELEAICKMDPNRPRIVIINYPANPTGTTYSTRQLEKIAKIARKYRVILLSDEIYGELHHSGRHVSVARYYPEGTIVSTGLSKWCGAGGWRLGMFLFPDNLRWLLEAMSVVASETYTSTSAPVQYAAITAFEAHPLVEEQLHHSRRILRALGLHLYERLKEINVFTPRPEGGFYLFPDFSHYQEALSKRGVYSSADLCDQLLERMGVALLPSYDFGRPSEELTARLSYVDFDGEQALKVAAEYGDQELDEAFLQQCCPRVLEAMSRIEEWVEELVR